MNSATALAAARAARGAVRSADSALVLASSFRHGAGVSPLATRILDRSGLLLSLAAGRQATPAEAYARDDDSPAGRLMQGLRSALVGDTLDARRTLESMRSATPSVRRDLREGTEILNAMLAASAGQWRAVVRILKPLADTGHIGRPPDARLRAHARWLVADAYERLEQPDSAARYFEILVDPVWAARDEEIGYRGLVLPFAHQRLVLLYARAGRLGDAQRHWKAFADVVTEPDSELQPLVRDARAALDRASRTKG
jgi:hypothetical protein